MIKALIFDLDNCLAAANEVGEELFEPAFEAIRTANRGTLTLEQLTEAFKECWRHPLDFLAQRFGFSKEMLAAGWKVFSQTVVETSMKGYGDLAVLRGLPFDLYLVTSGFRGLQESKVKALQTGDLFRGIEIDAIDEADRKGKQGHLRVDLESRKSKARRGHCRGRQSGFGDRGWQSIGNENCTNPAAGSAACGERYLSNSDVRRAENTPGENKSLIVSLNSSCAGTVMISVERV
jgi:phosphoglycolate phosphatase-like HAD superfamily hydrolase